ncbi:MAG: aminodeoxychorismate synthase component I [Gammaproteobacteria bacterium]|jgi:anthranilate synthase component 1
MAVLSRLLDRPANLLALHERCPSRYPHFLQSAARGGRNGRYDILFAFPGERLVLHADGRLERPPGVSADDFFHALDQWYVAVSWPGQAPGPLPFNGGWFLFATYETAGEVEPVLRARLRPEAALPMAIAERFPAAVIRDHERGETWLVAEPGHEACLADMQADIAAQPEGASPSGPRELLESGVIEDDPERYLAIVEQAKRYVYAGDVFQANLSRCWSARVADGVNHADIYRRLCHTNPAPFAGLASWGDAAVISSSPERLVSLRGRRVDTRPIAGTRPRNSDRDNDMALSRELMQHPKERAEHVMLIDLERNDLGRICEPGSVTVDEMMVLESYAHVHHIVSNVCGRVRANVRPGDVIRAVFPGGTITGCPKVRCMEIIAELEAAPRGAYTGSMGYLSRDGQMDTNILIRTLQRCGKRLEFRAGAGIVADSEPRHELAETRAKARGMLLALGLGER